MPIFSEKSGQRRIFRQAWCLTAGLPDVPTGGARHRALIRPVQPCFAAQELLEGCLQGAEISVLSPVAWQVRSGKIPQTGLPFIEGSTRMRLFKREATSQAIARDAARAQAIFRLAGALLAAALLFALTQAAHAQGAVRSVHGDWQIRCDTPPGAQGEQCALIQSVVAEDRSNAGLTVIVLKTADQKSKLMRVVAPLGVLLPSGLGLKLDNQDVGRAGFVRCLPNGCVAEVMMDDKLLGQLKGAKTATFIIFETPEEGIGFPLSLNGLSEGYDKLP